MAHKTEDRETYRQRRYEMKQYNRGQTPVEEAILRIVQSLPGPDGRKSVPLLEGLGRVLAQPVMARVPQPPFTRSPLDGYALRAADIEGASYGSPVRLPVSQYLPAGCSLSSPLPRGMAARIMTGAPIPEGADCVIRQEDTDQGEEEAEFYAYVEAGKNICHAGEDIAAGDQLLKSGTRLTFAHIGVLAGQGMNQVEVYDNPRVAVMSTGDELVAPGAALTPGKIYDSNSMMLAARLMELGIKPDLYTAGPDEPGTLSALLDGLLDRYSLVITTGGVSVGKRDFMPAVADMAHTELLFHGIDAKPGSPVLAAVRGQCVLLALSGNPFASVATFELLALPALSRLSGETQWKAVRTQANLKGNFNKSSKIRRFIRARIEGGNVSIPEKGHSSGGIGNLADCNCMIDVPGGSGSLSEGDTVTVWLF